MTYEGDAQEFADRLTRLAEDAREFEWYSLAGTLYVLSAVVVAGDAEGLSKISDAAKSVSDSHLREDQGNV